MTRKAAFLIGILLSLIFDFVQTVLAYGNGFLFAVGIICFLITIYGLCVNLSVYEELKINWMLLYLIPMAIINVGVLSRHHEAQNELLALAGENLIINVLPGRSFDYFDSVATMQISFLIPPMTVLFYGIIRLLIYIYDELL